jgi:hypothetical protein
MPGGCEFLPTRSRAVSECCVSQTSKPAGCRRSRLGARILSRGVYARSFGPTTPRRRSAVKRAWAWLKRASGIGLQRDCGFGRHGAAPRAVGAPPAALALRGICERLRSAARGARSGRRPSVRADHQPLEVAHNWAPGVRYTTPLGLRLRGSCARRMRCLPRRGSKRRSDS